MYLDTACEQINIPFAFTIIILGGRGHYVGALIGGIMWIKIDPGQGLAAERAPLLHSAP